MANFSNLELSNSRTGYSLKGNLFQKNYKMPPFIFLYKGDKNWAEQGNFLFTCTLFLKEDLYDPIIDDISNEHETQLQIT